MFGKNVGSYFNVTFKCVKSLCRSNRSHAFFSARLRLRTFLYLGGSCYEQYAKPSGKF